MKDNELIAEFMGLHRLDTEHDAFFTDVETSPYKWHSYHLAYNTSWNWLMPVVEKIESLGFTFIIDNNEANILSDQDPDKGLFLRTYPTKLESTYAVAVEFIKWYNDRKVEI